MEFFYLLEVTFHCISYAENCQNQRYVANSSKQQQSKPNLAQKILGDTGTKPQATRQRHGEDGDPIHLFVQASRLSEILFVADLLALKFLIGGHTATFLKSLGSEGRSPMV